MDSSSESRLVAKGSTGPFVTPSTSAGTLTEQLSVVTISTELSKTASNRGVKRPAAPSSSSEDTFMPANKKNRDYLPKESKPLYFDLKKTFKKKSQWAANERFMTNCADTGNFPRAVQYKCPPPWEFTSQELTRQWASVQQKAPAELCKLVALDCKAKLVNCQAVIDSLFQELKKLIPEVDFKEITSELQHDCNNAVDRQYAEKILGRNAAPKPKGNSNTPSTSKKPNPKARKQKPAGKSPGGRSRSRRRRSDPQPDRTAGIRNRPAAVKQDLMRQLNELSKAIKLMK